jgi:hypothetical protein
MPLGMQLHQGVKKSGLMGFCDPCPGESKQLKIIYSYQGHCNEVFLSLYVSICAQMGRGCMTLTHMLRQQTHLIYHQFSKGGIEHGKTTFGFVPGTRRSHLEIRSYGKCLQGLTLMQLKQNMFG